MEIIATYWWVWLICMFAFFGVAMFNQINRIRRMGILIRDSMVSRRGCLSLQSQGWAAPSLGFCF